MYPSTSKFANRGRGLGNKEPPLPDAPTDALPGSPKKVAVLEERVKLGLALWHPEDPTIKTHGTGLPLVADAPKVKTAHLGTVTYRQVTADMKAEMIVLYLADETAATVAARFDCSKATVYKVLKIAGVGKRKLKPRGFADWTGHRWHG